MRNPQLQVPGRPGHTRRHWHLRSRNPAGAHAEQNPRSPFHASNQIKLSHVPSVGDVRLDALLHPFPDGPLDVALLLAEEMIDPQQLERSSAAHCSPIPVSVSAAFSISSSLSSTCSATVPNGTAVLARHSLNRAAEAGFGQSRDGLPSPPPLCRVSSTTRTLPVDRAAARMSSTGRERASAGPAPAAIPAESRRARHPQTHQYPHFEADHGQCLQIHCHSSGHDRSAQ